MKRVSHTLTYPGTTVDEVFAMFADPAYRTAVSEYQQVDRLRLRHHPERRRDGRARSSRPTAPTGCPASPRSSSATRSASSRRRRGRPPPSADLHVTIPGKPGEITGTETLAQSGDDVVQSIDLAVKVSMPLVGGKVEDLIAGFVGQVFDAENKVGVKWLAGEWRV